MKYKVGDILFVKQDRTLNVTSVDEDKKTYKGYDSMDEDHTKLVEFTDDDVIMKL